MSDYLIPVIRLKDFQFNEEILLLQPINLKNDDTKYTLIKEVSQEYLVNASTKRVVRKCCAVFGTSLEEATRLSREITGASNKLPIVIGPTSNPFVLIPTSSPDRHFTSWISLTAIKKFDAFPTYNCEILLTNLSTFKSEISTSSIHTQIARAFIIHAHYATLTHQPATSLTNKNFTSVSQNSIEKP